MKRYTVTEECKITCEDGTFVLESGDVISINEEDNGWPEDVEKGGLRKRLDLDPNKPLEDQTTPEKVAKYFEQAGEDGRGKVMYAVNSNQDNEFWKKVGELISDNKEES